MELEPISLAPPKTIYPDDVFWATVDTASLDTPYTAGNVTFANTKFSDGISGSDQILNVEVAFGLTGGFAHDATVGLTHGLLEICAGTGSGMDCGRSDGNRRFHVRFSGENNDGYFTGTINEVLKLENDIEEDLTSLINGGISGIFTGADQNEGLYDAFAGGFNLSEAGISSHFL